MHRTKVIDILPHSQFKSNAGEIDSMIISDNIPIGDKNLIIQTTFSHHRTEHLTIRKERKN